MRTIVGWAALTGLVLAGPFVPSSKAADCAALAGTDTTPGGAASVHAEAECGVEFLGRQPYARVTVDVLKFDGGVGGTETDALDADGDGKASEGGAGFGAECPPPEERGPAKSLVCALLETDE